MRRVSHFVGVQRPSSNVCGFVLQSVQFTNMDFKHSFAKPYLLLVIHDDPYLWLHCSSLGEEEWEAGRTRWYLSTSSSSPRARSSLVRTTTPSKTALLFLSIERIPYFFFRSLFSKLCRDRAMEWYGTLDANQESGFFFRTLGWPMIKCGGAELGEKKVAKKSSPEDLVSIKVFASFWCCWRWKSFEISSHKVKSRAGSIATNCKTGKEKWKKIEKNFSK